MELRMEDEDGYKKFIRMTPEIFDDLPNLIECDIKKKSTFERDPRPPNIKLAVTLRFLSAGANYAEFQHIFEDKAYRKTGTLVGHYKNRKTGTLMGPYKKKKTEMWDECTVWVYCKCMKLVAAGSCTRKWLRFNQTIRNLTSGDLGISLVVS